MNTKKNFLGFSLIELMVVIAIVTVLAAIAVPAYKRYIAKGKLATLAGMSEDGKNNWLQNNQTNQPLPSATGPTGQYVQSIVIDSSGVSILLNNPSAIDETLDGATIQYTPFVSSEGIVTWACTVLTGGSVSSYSTFNGSPNSPNSAVSFNMSAYAYKHMHQASVGAPDAAATALVCG